MTGQPQLGSSVDVLSNLGKLGSENLQRFLDGNAVLVTPTSVEQLGELVRQRVRVDVEEALGLAEAAIAIASRLSDGVSLGRSFRAKANALWFKGNCKAAVELFERAVTEFEVAGLSAEVGRTLSSSIQTLVLLGEYERAGAAAEKARKIFSDLGDDWRRARLELNAANIDHRQDRFAEALARYEHAYEELLRYKDAEGSGVALHNMAVCLIMLNDFDRALGCYQRVRELCRKSGMPLLELQADYNIAYLYFLRGDYKAAIEGLHRTREQCRSNGDAYHAALCNLDEAEIYLELNLIDEAARLADEARHQFEGLGMAFETGRSTANLAIANHRQAHSKRALELFTEARAIFAGEGNEAWLALIDLYQAMVKFELGGYEDSRSLCVRAREFFKGAGLDRREIICELLLVRLSLAIGDVRDARAECDLVLQKLDGLNAPLLSFQAHLLLGHIERGSGPSACAHQAYESARSALETLRSTVQSEELKISFLKDKIDLYESLVAVSLELNSETAADSVLQYIQQAKSRSLAELVYGKTTELGWNAATGAQAQRVRELRGELNWFSRRIAIEQTAGDGFSVERINRLRAEARWKENELVRAVRDIEATSGKSGVPETAIPMEAAAIRSALDPDATIAEYFLISGEFVAVVIDARGANVVRLTSLDRVRSRLRMLEFQLSKFRLDKSYSSDFEAALLGATLNHLHELYKDLVAPLAPLIRGKHLVIGPHGMLHYVPFHALFDGSEYLIDRFTISFAPSASIYAMCHKRLGNREGPSLLMGINDDNAPWIDHEIRSVATVVPEPQVFLGELATSDVLRSVGRSSRLIHIATHGLFRKDNPMFSSICLADQHISLYDLYELRLPVELVTMSGCGTGLSVVAAGDELLGLTRGLLSAGAQTILLSLWDVHDRTTAELMTIFYNCLAQGCDKAVALRTAMIETRSRHPHPYFWAPFVLIGKAFESSN